MPIVPRHLEDFTVGYTFTTDPVTVTEADITGFATSFDPQTFHTDPVRAGETFFGELIASGWHTAALTMRMMVQSGRAPAWGFIGRGIEKLAWPRPVRAGDTLRVRVEAIEIIPSRSKPQVGTVRLAMTTLNQNDDEVQTMIAAVLVPTRLTITDAAPAA